MTQRILHFTLLPEGTSDRALMPILEWTLSQHFPPSKWTTVGDYVQSDRLPAGKVADLSNRIATTIAVYDCDLLFVHRDADSSTIDHRESEIQAAVAQAGITRGIKLIPVIPVRMSETWLLIDEGAIRKAAGFSRGKHPLDLPRITELERRADAKTILQTKLRLASGRTGRKLNTFNVNEARSMIASYIDDLSRLRLLDSFQRFEDAVRKSAS